MGENKKTPQEIHQEVRELQEILCKQDKELFYLRLILEETVKTNRHFLVMYFFVGVVFVLEFILLLSIFQ
ncbi:hypothetical protein [Turicibacter sanguinis]|uniref:hypothetical protein n=1 Tax=Turicibacter sanguinis TaxID=154288 RepID=UPI0029434F3F|nr:hypothetical protein [Turicibacter sanguinis]